MLMNQKRPNPILHALALRSAGLARFVQTHHKRLIAPVALVAAILASASLHATPYATAVTNDAGTVSFRLNQTTATNDTVLVISGNGAVTNTLQLPSTDASKILSRGLIQTNLGIAAGPVKIYIKHVGSGVISTNSP